MLVRASFGLLLVSSLSAQQLAPAPARGYVDTRLLPLDVSAGAFGDIDGDGDPDLAIGDRVFRNEPTSSFLFVDATQNGAAPNPHALPKFGDVDGDGDLDLVRGPGDLWINDGFGGFSDVSATHMPPAPPWLTTAMELADVDGDGDLDLLFGSLGGFPLPSGNGLWVNDGSGHFTDVSLAQFPAADNVLAMGVDDLDGDGDVDVVIGLLGQPAFGFDNADRLYWNDGTGHFTQSSALDTQSFYVCGTDVAIADIDGDSDNDIVMCYDFNASEVGPQPWLPIRIWQNDGTGAFNQVTDTHLGGANVDDCGGLALADIDGDGDVDLISGRVRFNNGSGIFSPPVPADVPVYGEAIADIDGDGDLDTYGERSVFRNDGGGTFTDLGNLWPRVPEFRSFAGVGEFLTGEPVNLEAFGRALGHPVFDMDLDGELDVLQWHYWGGTTSFGQLFLDSGNGADFTYSNYISLTANIQPTAWVAGDVDQDGDADVVVATNLGGTTGASVPMLRSDGAGDVTVSWLPSAQTRSNAVDIGDVDGDGDLDVVIGNGDPGAPQPNELLLNTGAGLFVPSATPLPGGAAATRMVSLGDVDGDGDLDLVVDDTGPAGPLPQLYLNDGAGHFTAAPRSHLLHGGALADVDLDGDLDVFVTTTGEPGAPHPGVACNDGTGRFAFVPNPACPRGVATGLVGDIDLDGDIDQWSSVGWLLNRHRQIEAPDLARPGLPFRLRFCARTGYAPDATVFVPWLGFGEATIPTPFGTMRFDPTTALPMDALMLAPTESVVEVVFTIPTDPVFFALEFQVQAVAMSLDKQTLPPGFTNLVKGRVLER